MTPQVCFLLSIAFSLADGSLAERLAVMGAQFRSSFNSAARVVWG